jgi:hypothetical protein
MTGEKSNALYQLRKDNFNEGILAERLPGNSQAKISKFSKV